MEILTIRVTLKIDYCKRNMFKSATNLLVRQYGKLMSDIAFTNSAYIRMFSLLHLQNAPYNTAFADN